MIVKVLEHLRCSQRAVGSLESKVQEQLALLCNGSGCSSVISVQPSICGKVFMLAKPKVPFSDNIFIIALVLYKLEEENLVQGEPCWWIKMQWRSLSLTVYTFN